MKIESPIEGSVWTHAASVGQRIAAGAQLLVLESMKTEIPVASPIVGEVIWLRPCGDQIRVGDVVAIVDERP